MTCAECSQTIRPLEVTYLSADKRSCYCEYCWPYLRSDVERLKRERVKA